MADERLFASRNRPNSPAADAFNRESAPAYDYEPKAKLTQLAATGTLAGYTAPVNNSILVVSDGQTTQDAAPLRGVGRASRRGFFG